MEPLLKAEHVSVIYNEGKSNEYVALNDINLEIYPEEYIIFFGPSGSGKSTMLYTLLGLQAAAKGKVYVKGRDSSLFDEKEKTRTSSQFFGIIFQNFNLIYSLNVADNVMLPQVFVDVPYKERKTKAEILMERFGIMTRSKNLPNNLSGGQQQRVAISRSLMNDPQILLADEPVGNLDSESAKVVMHTLSEINRKDKKTIILVTHDPSYLQYADRVFYFKDAKLERTVKNDNPVILCDLSLESMTKKTEQHNPEEELMRLASVRQSFTVPELKAWILTQFLIREMTTDQFTRLEKCMERLLEGSLDFDGFQAELHLPFSKGGVGLYSATAHKYAKKIEEVMHVVDQFKKEIRGNHKQRHDIIHLLRRFILNEHEELTRLQNTRLEQAITARINQEITTHEFAALAHRPLNDGGAGLRLTTAEHLAEKLDVILAEVQHYEGT